MKNSIRLIVVAILLCCATVAPVASILASGALASRPTFLAVPVHARMPFPAAPAAPPTVVELPELPELTILASAPARHKVPTPAHNGCQGACEWDLVRVTELEQGGSNSGGGVKRFERF